VAGVPPDDAARALAEAPTPPGRFEVVQRALHARATGESALEQPTAGPRVVVDYAHSPDALARTLAVARTLCEGTLVVVFGAGGDRDRDKRAPMGAAAARADRVVLTSDNPRSEDPAHIAQAIRAGVPAERDGTVELDRRKAIALAVRGAGPRDVVVIAGRGPETEQIVGEARIPLDDAVEARAALAS
jgi:UDP-N-acetylmuramoyl-L-alanyl-D-glutamate--2,6-diaminopimelate ligase